MKERLSGEKQSKLKFIGLYVGSMILLALIFSLFIPARTVIAPAQPITVVKPDALSQTDAFLHHGYAHLQTLDAQFAAALSDSSVLEEPIMSKIAVAESEFRSSLDSIQRIHDAKGGGAGFSEADSVVASFRSLLSSRRTLATFRSLLTSDQNTAGDEAVAQMKLASELVQKEQEIATLQKQLKLTEVLYERPAGPVKHDVNEEPAENSRVVDQLNQRLNAMRKDNESLAAQLVAVRKAATEKESQMADMREKSASLEKNSGELAAELRFAQVDCNLSRANIKEIISNSRQRQELLTQSLNILNDLAQSDNSVVQRKAKDKLVQLKNIASVIHD
jgi:chromosome segregation ATPase